jgi:hypothetical protein
MMLHAKPHFFNALKYSLQKSGRFVRNMAVLLQKTGLLSEECSWYYNVFCLDKATGP